MKEITLRIPDNKLAFFMELTNQLGLEVLEEENPIQISEVHKQSVRERIQKATDDPDRLLIWDEVKDNFQL